LLAYQQGLASTAGFTEEDIEELKRAIDEKFGRAEDSE
jgi:CRISPR/Cas system type I-B associated protein Csh2 (Cas7 group RAMP superfamily)